MNTTGLCTDPRVLRILEMIDRLPDVEHIQRTGGGWTAAGGVQETIIALRADAANIRRFPAPDPYLGVPRRPIVAHKIDPVFVRFDCDCVGILDGHEAPIVVQRCDNRSDEDRYGLVRRIMCDNGVPKSYTPLTSEENETLLATLNRYVQDGHRFQEMRALLGLGSER